MQYLQVKLNFLLVLEQKIVLKILKTRRFKIIGFRIYLPIIIFVWLCVQIHPKSSEHFYLKSEYTVPYIYSYICNFTIYYIFREKYIGHLGLDNYVSTIIVL